MNWEVVGATGEWAGALVVVISLLYLARQIHHATRQARAAARYSFLDAYNDTHAAIFQSKQASAIYRAGLEDELSDPDEMMQFTCIVANFLNSWAVFYDLHCENELPDNQWEIVAKDMHSVFSTPGGRKVWDKTGRVAMNRDFVLAVDALLESGEAAYSFLPARSEQADK